VFKVHDGDGEKLEKTEGSKPQKVPVLYGKPPKDAISFALEEISLILGFPQKRIHGRKAADKQGFWVRLLGQMCRGMRVKVRGKKGVEARFELSFDKDRK
jgi:hypothetical protein